jgi:hypothetical protein
MTQAAWPAPQPRPKIWRCKLFVKFLANFSLVLSSISKYFFGGFVCYQGVTRQKFAFFGKIDFLQIFGPRGALSPARIPVWTFRAK